MFPAESSKLKQGAAQWRRMSAAAVRLREARVERAMENPAVRRLIVHPCFQRTDWALCTEQMPTYLKSTLIISVECVYQ